MNKPNVSIVMPTHNRGHLFRRSLECYARQTFKDFEILLLDDESTDDMQDLCRVFAPGLGLDLKHIWFKKPAAGVFRDGACQINYGIRAAVGNLIITTSPEVMPGKNTIREMLRMVEGEGVCWNTTAWISAKVYLLSPAQQQLLDTVDWRGLGPAPAVRHLPDFYKLPSAEYQGAGDFLPARIDQAPIFGAALFCGMTRRGWREIGGYPESETWGSPDPSFLAERWRRGTKQITIQDPDAVCVHQSHDAPGDIITPRNMEQCLANCIRGPWDFIRW